MTLKFIVTAIPTIILFIIFLKINYFINNIYNNLINFYFFKKINNYNKVFK